MKARESPPLCKLARRILLFIFYFLESAGTERILLEFYKLTLLKKHENTWWVIGVLLVESLLSLDSSCSCSAWPPHCWTPVAALCQAAWSRHELHALSSGGKSDDNERRLNPLYCVKSSPSSVPSQSHPLIIIFAANTGLNICLCRKLTAESEKVKEELLRRGKKKQNKKFSPHILMKLYLRKSKREKVVIYINCLWSVKLALKCVIAPLRRNKFHIQPEKLKFK